MAFSLSPATELHAKYITRIMTDLMWMDHVSNERIICMMTGETPETDLRKVRWLS